MWSKWDPFMRPLSKHESFWMELQIKLNELTPDKCERRILIDIIESFWECHGEKIRTYSPQSTEWNEEIRSRLSEYLEFEDEKCSIMSRSNGTLDVKNTIETILQKLMEIAEELNKGLIENESDLQECMTAYWQSHHQHWLVFSNRFTRWREAFRYVVDQIFNNLVQKLEKQSLDYESAKAFLDSQRMELLSNSYRARNWNVVFENLLEDCLNFPDESHQTCYSPDWRSEHSTLEKLLGKSWIQYRESLLKQARQRRPWKTLFIGLLESISMCLSESASVEQSGLGEFKRKSDEVVNNLLESEVDTDCRTREFIRVTIAEIMRFNFQEIRVSGVAVQVSKHLDFLSKRETTAPNIFGLGAYTQVLDITLKFCEYQQTGAVFSEEEQTDQLSYLRMHSAPAQYAEKSAQRLSLTQQNSVPAETYMSFSPEINWVPSNIEIEEIEIKSNTDLILRTKLSNKGKTIIFTDNRVKPAFKSRISVRFPRCSVLAEEKICLEIVPESIVEAYNEILAEKNKEQSEEGIKPRLITPILHIDRGNDAPFLRTVTVTLPLLIGIKFESDEIKCEAPGKLSLADGSVKVATVKFSPVGVAEVQKILRPLKLDKDFNYSFDELGVYFLSEQLENRHFKLDLRRFSDWQEHRRFRMDESKWLVLVISPQRVKPGDIDTKVEAHLRDPIIISNDWESNKVRPGNRVLFHFPNPALPPDATNWRNMTLNTNRACQQFPIKLEYKTENLENFAISELFHVPYHPEDRIHYFLNARVLNTERTMVRLLELLGENWIEFLGRYLNTDTQGLFEFLSNDIRETFAPERLNWLPDNVNHLKNICLRREFVFPPTSRNSGDIIESIFSNFRTALEMGRAKREIRRLLLDSGVISRNADFTDNLLERNREILAEALMYIPMGSMKPAILQAFDANLLPIDWELRNFVNDGMPEGERI